MPVYKQAFSFTLSIVLKSSGVKMFPTKGAAQGPGGKLGGLPFFTTSNISRNTNPNRSQPVKSMQSKRAWKIMVKKIVRMAQLRWKLSLLLQLILCRVGQDRKAEEKNNWLQWSYVIVASRGPMNSNKPGQSGKCSRRLQTGTMYTPPGSVRGPNNVTN